MNQDPDSEYIARHHQHEPSDNQTTSVLTKRIRAPVETVWSFVKRFDEPQCYKPFVKSCNMQGDVKVGSVREVCVVSGLPATTSIEALQTYDEERQILGYKVLGGDHRLRNYSSITSLHAIEMDGEPATLVIESYIVDVPEGNTQVDTRFFVEALIKCNLKCLAEVSERLAAP